MRAPVSLISYELRSGRNTGGKPTAPPPYVPVLNQRSTHTTVTQREIPRVYFQASAARPCLVASPSKLRVRPPQRKEKTSLILLCVRQFKTPSRVSYEYRSPAQYISLPQTYISSLLYLHTLKKKLDMCPYVTRCSCFFYPRLLRKIWSFSKNNKIY